MRKIDNLPIPDQGAISWEFWRSSLFRVERVVLRAGNIVCTTRDGGFIPIQRKALFEVSRLAYYHLFMC